MSAQVFSAKLVLTNSLPTVAADEFDIDAAVSDSTGVFSALDVQVGDVVFLDTRTSVSVPNVVSRYTVKTITSATFTTISCKLKYADSGSPVDPIDASGQNSFISRPSPSKKFTWLPGPEVQGIPVDIIELAQNSEFWDRVDIISGASPASGKASENDYFNLSGLTIPAITPVKETSGDIEIADPGIESDVLRLIGVTKTAVNASTSGTVVMVGLIENITTSFGFNDTVYLAKSGALTNQTPDIGTLGFASGDFVVRVGRIVKNSSNPANKDLLVRIEIVGQL